MKKYHKHYKHRKNYKFYFRHLYYEMQLLGHIPKGASGKKRLLKYLNVRTVRNMW